MKELTRVITLQVTQTIECYDDDCDLVEEMSVSGVKNNEIETELAKAAFADDVKIIKTQVFIRDIDDPTEQTKETEA